MPWNPWKHLRLAGALIIIVAALAHLSLVVTVVGLTVQYIGVVGAIDRAERLIDILAEQKENPDEKDA